VNELNVSKEARNETRSAGLLAASGIFSQLQAACLTLVNCDPELIRSMMISTCNADGDESVDYAIRRYAGEQCLVADVERRAGALIVRLRRAQEGNEG
jgi:hypothetical protein